MNNRQGASAALTLAAAIAALAGFIALAPGRASAMPQAAAAFCSAYPEAKACVNGAVPCAMCHTTPPARNPFGAALSARIAPGVARPLTPDAFLSGLKDALKASEQDDADGDGITNLAEVLAGAWPGDPMSKPLLASCTAAQAKASRGRPWNVCGYDPAYAFRKVNLDFCGRSATRAELAAFAKLAGDRKRWEPALGAALDRCLTSHYWLGKNGAVWNLANAKIRPAHTVKSGADAGPVPLADYDDDFNLFTWTNTGGHDVRDQLLAQYYVKRISDDPVKLAIIPEEELKTRSQQTSQNVPREKRVGLITTRWNGAINTMFTAVPRTTAAQAYRAYLGFDLAKMQGLQPVSHEPADFDAKGVTAPQCAACHSTLDPLTYPFTRYNGIGRYNYEANRLKNYTKSDGPRITDAPESGILLGHPVKDLLEWGQVAANSDAFAQKVALDYWKLLVGRDPETHAQDQPEFTQLWKGLKAKDGYNYRVEKMLHGLVLTQAYGRP